MLPYLSLCPFSCSYLSSFSWFVVHSVHHLLLLPHVSSVCTDNAINSVILRDLTFLFLFFFVGSTVPGGNIQSGSVCALGCVRCVYSVPTAHSIHNWYTHTYIPDNDFIPEDWLDVITWPIPAPEIKWPDGIWLSTLVLELSKVEGCGCSAAAAAAAASCFFTSSFLCLCFFLCSCLTASLGKLLLYGSGNCVGEKKATISTQQLLATKKWSNGRQWKYIVKTTELWHTKQLTQHLMLWVLQVIFPDMYSLKAWVYTSRAHNITEMYHMRV